ncbi:MAG: 5-methyltetrahydropteroyltriglutamate--homocysteine S-methyltransferase [Alphaproteobacteria bacterium]
MSIKPPFRADQVGSLLRPASLTRARSDRKAGKLSAAELRAEQDAAIRAAVAKQEQIGLQAVTDGEMRRDYWHLDFVRQLDGVTITQNPGLKFGLADAEEQPPIAQVAGKVRYARPIMVDDFAFLKNATSRIAKMTIPSPTILHLRGGRSAISRAAYPDLDEFWSDVGAAYRKEITALGTAGCTYLQLDDVGFSYLCDPNFQDTCRRNGDDPMTLPQRYVDVINAALAERPAGMRVSIHTCRGNYRSTWVAQGGYEPVAEVMFQANVDGFFMEFDDDRSGGFEPLRFLPKNKRAVLGIITSKSGTIEREDQIRRRIDEAAKIAPLENLCLSPQCGFSSTHEGNKLTEDDQWRKLALIVDIARKVWGDN